MMRALAWGLALLVPLSLARAQDAPKDADKPLKIDGKLSPDDAKDKVRKNAPHKVHEHKMSAGKTYTINLVSKDFDSYLRLEDSGGKQLAEDDDGGGFPNARIVFKAPKDDKYRIIVTSYDGKAGAYTLTAEVATGASAKLSTLKEDFAARQKELIREYGKAATEEAKDAVKDRFFEALAEFLVTLSRFAEENAKDPAADEARKEIRFGLRNLAQAESPAVAKALRALRQSASKDLQGPVNLALVQNIRAQYERAYQKRDKEADKLLAEAQSLLKQVTNNQPDLSDDVKKIEFELDKLTVGRPAMDIEGEDIDGKKFKLSDYRGKVVVLDFWGHW